MSASREGIIKHNKTLLFVAPLVGLTIHNKENIKNSYIYYGKEEGYIDSILEENIYIETFNVEPSLKHHGLCQQETVLRNSVIYKMKLSELAYDTLVKVLEGKYSEIPKSAQARIAAVIPSTVPIMGKCVKRRAKIEELLDVKLPKDAEVFSIPNINEEIIFVN